MTTIAEQDATTAPTSLWQPQQEPGACPCPSCIRLAEIALGMIRDRLDEITARDEATDAKAAALLGKGGAR